MSLSLLIIKGPERARETDREREGGFTWDSSCVPYQIPEEWLLESTCRTCMRLVTKLLLQGLVDFQCGLEARLGFHGSGRFSNMVFKYFDLSTETSIGCLEPCRGL